MILGTYLMFMESKLKHIHTSDNTNPSQDTFTFYITDQTWKKIFSSYANLGDHLPAKRQGTIKECRLLGVKIPCSRFGKIEKKY